MGGRAQDVDAFGQVADVDDAAVGDGLLEESDAGGAVEDSLLGLGADALEGDVVLCGVGRTRERAYTGVRPYIGVDAQGGLEGDDGDVAEGDLVAVDGQCVVVEVEAVVCVDDETRTWACIVPPPTRRSTAVSRNIFFIVE